LILSNQLADLLTQWVEGKGDADWVLGTVYKTEGHAYRKAGAMMIFDGNGRQYGLLSGGCLEADIRQQARKVLHCGRPLTVTYDGADEDDLSFQLGIGCGGTVQILLQPVTMADDLGLTEVALTLKERRSGTYYQRIPLNGEEAAAHFDSAVDGEKPSASGRSRLFEKEGELWLATPIVPEPHLLVIGGGVDAQPVVSLAKELGWRVSLCDPRPANARREFFPRADHILREVGDVLRDYAMEMTVDAAVLMSHNITLDAIGLKCMSRVPLKYLSLLGPSHRRDQVLAEAELAKHHFSVPLAGPAGLDLGGALPESVALAILAECHAALEGCDARSFSGVLKT